MHTTWAGPEPRQMAFRHPMVLFVSRDAGIRRAAEDRMAYELPGATQSYAVVPEDVLQDKDKVKQMMRDAGYDGVVVMKVVAVQEGFSDGYRTYGLNFVAIPGELRRDNDLWGYWDTSWGRVYNPGSYYDTQRITVDSGVYSVSDGQLLWSGQSETLNPTSLKSLLNSVVHKSIKEARKQGLS